MLSISILATNNNLHVSFCNFFTDPYFLKNNEPTFENNTITKEYIFLLSKYQSIWQISGNGYLNPPFQFKDSLIWCFLTTHMLKPIS